MSSATQPGSARQRVTMARILAPLFLLSFLWALNRPESVPAAPLMTSGDFLDPELVPIYTSADAISRTLQFVPSGHNYTGITTRLIGKYDLLTGWFQQTDPEYISDWTDGPLWLVGMLGDNLIMSDTRRIPGASFLNAETTPVDGLFTIWDANAGQMIAAGAIDRDLLFTYNMLLALPNQSLSISHATALPGLYPPTPTPTPVQ